MINRFRRLAGNPVFIGQAATSLAAAVAFFIVAFRSSADTLSSFALLNLLGTAVPGAVRAGLLVPAMVQLRTDGSAFVPFRYAAVSAIILSGIGATYAAIIGGGVCSLLFGVGCALVVVAEWLRYRWLADRLQWRVAFGDLARLAAVPSLFFLPLDSGIVAQFWIQALSIPAIICWLIGFRPLLTYTTYRTYGAAARTQLLEYGVLQLNTIVPMLTIGAISATPLIAAVRLAQTCFGPMNVISSATTTHLLAEGATGARFSKSRELISFGSRLSHRMVVLSLSIMVVGIAAAWISPLLPEGVGSESLMIAFLLVGLQSTSSAWTGIHNVIMRFLGEHKSIVISRALVVSAAAFAYLTAYLVMGADSSLVAGMIVSALAGALAFWLPARRRYRREGPDSGGEVG